VYLDFEVNTTSIDADGRWKTNRKLSRGIPKKRTLSAALATENSDNVIVEPSVGEVPLIQQGGEVSTIDSIVLENTNMEMISWRC